MINNVDSKKRNTGLEYKLSQIGQTPSGHVVTVSKGKK